MDFGLRPQELAEIIGLIRQFSDIEETVIFGSRAKGNYKKGSDIDIAIKGEKISSEDIASLADLLNEESILPYYFDIVHYDAITEKALTEHIDRVGKTIYLRETM